MATAGVLIIGNEVLSGKVDEANARYLIPELRALGIRLTRLVVVRDEVDAIADEVGRMSAGHDFVFTSGGVGATHDDLTMHAVARGFGVELVVHPELEAFLAARYGGAPPEAARRMARVPAVAELLWRPSLKYPIVKVRNVFVLPGVPEFFRIKFEALRPLIAQTERFVLRELFVGWREEEFANALAEVARQHPAVEIGSYPRFDDADHQVRLTVEGTEDAPVEAAFRAIAALFPPDAIVRGSF